MNNCKINKFGECEIALNGKGDKECSEFLLSILKDHEIVNDFRISNDKVYSIMEYHALLFNQKFEETHNIIGDEEAFKRIVGDYRLMDDVTNGFGYTPYGIADKFSLNVNVVKNTLKKENLLVMEVGRGEVLLHGKDGFYVMREAKWMDEIYSLFE